MRILILGGDGYLGWPTAMHLSARGFETAVADNYLRRALCREQNVAPLYDVPDLEQRVAIWRKHSGCEIVPFIGDLSDWSFVETIFARFTRTFISLTVYPDFCFRIKSLSTLLSSV